MQTLTHLSIGLSVPLVFVDYNDPLVAPFVLGSVAPDLVTWLPAWILNGFSALVLKEYKKKCPSIKRKAFFHSLIVWGAAVLFTPHFFLGYTPGCKMVLAFICGAFVHSLLDACTHGKPNGKPWEVTYLWPIRFNLASVVGCLQYRTGKGFLLPQVAWEWACLVGALGNIFYQVSS